MVKRSLAGLLMALMGFAGSAVTQAGEIWVEPSKRAAQKAVGNWPVANLGGETHFAWHVPDNFDSNAKALILIIPSEDGMLNYVVHRNVAKHGQDQATMPASPGVLTIGPLTRGQLTEIDVSTILPTLAVSDYVTINLEMATKKDTTQVVGLRFQYDTVYQERVTGSCPAGQHLREIKADGTVTCEADMHVKGTGCPAGHVATGYDANGVIQCKVDLDTRAVGACPAGQVVSAINSNGTVTCVADQDMHVKGTSCPAGQVLTGYAANGDPQCSALGTPGQPQANVAIHLHTASGGRQYIVPSGKALIIDYINFNDTWDNSGIQKSIHIQHSTNPSGAVWNTTVNYSPAGNPLFRPLIIPENLALLAPLHNNILYKCFVYGKLVDMNDVNPVYIHLHRGSGGTQYIVPPGKVLKIDYVAFNDTWHHSGDPKRFFLQHSTNPSGAVFNTTFNFSTGLNRLTTPLEVPEGKAILAPFVSPNGQILHKVFFFGELLDVESP